MNRVSTGKLLVAAIVLQAGILMGMLINAGLPLWVGEEIRVKTLPVDPRSMFRGNYARLNYDFSRLPADALSDAGRIRVGEVVYVQLAAGPDGLYTYKGAGLERPASGVYLRGRVSNTYQPYLVKFGIEAFFAPKARALALENDLRSSGVAVLKVMENGRVALKAVEPRS